MTDRTAPTTARHTPVSRADYPQRWLERYGRSLTRDELRLVQAYRGTRTQRDKAPLLAAAFTFIVDPVTGRAR